MVLRMLQPLGRCRVCPPPALELGTVRGSLLWDSERLSLLWDSEGLSVMQLSTGSIPQAEPLIYSTGRAQTRGCVYLKNPIPKLSVPKWGLSPPSYSAIPSLPPEVPGAFPLSSPSEGPLLCSTSPGLLRKRSREDPWRLPILPALSSLLYFGELGTSVLISHQCWRGGTMATPANANIGPPCLQRRVPRTSVTAPAPRGAGHCHAMMERPLQSLPGVDLPSLRLQVWILQSFSRGWCPSLPVST